MSEWMRVSNALVDEIERGVVRADERLPADSELAARFGVHRHTVRRALTDLQSRGFVRSERGRGTFVVRDAIAYRFGGQTRFEENLAANQLIATRQVLAVAQFGAPEDIARQLQIEPGQAVLMVTLLGEADSTPVHLFTMWFPLDRAPGAKAVFDTLPRHQPIQLAMDQLMQQVGIGVFRRKNARITCRLPRKEEARDLKISLNDPVFEAEIPNVDENGRTVYFGVTIYPGSRTAFNFDF